MTKIFIAKPPVAPRQDTTPPKGYQVTPEAMALKPYTVEPLNYPLPSKGPYLTDAGSEFDFEINVLDPNSKRPVRGVEVKTGQFKGFTDRIGRIVFRLPRGSNKIVIEGNGFVESGSFTPESVTFEPVVLDVDLDSNSTVSVYTSGEVVRGERHDLENNPGHGLGSSHLSEWLSKNWLMLGLVGATGLTMYFMGRGRTSSHQEEKSVLFSSSQCFQ